MIQEGRTKMSSGNKWIVVSYALVATSFLMVSFYAYSGYQSQVDHDEKVGLFSSIPGGRAWDYLQNSTFSELLFEVDILSPYLDEGSDLKQFDVGYLAEHFDLAESILKTECMTKTIRYEWSHSQFDYSYDFSSPRYPEYTASELRELAGSCRNYSTSGHTSLIHTIFLDGRYVPPTDDEMAIGGVNYAGTTVDAITIFIFLPETVENSLYGPEYPYLSRDIAHELGHLLGLVAPFENGSANNAPTAVDHQNNNSARHCSNISCLMSTDINKKTVLCPECQADLAYLRNSTAPYAVLSVPKLEWIPIVAGATLGIVAVVTLIRSRRRQR